VIAHGHVPRLFRGVPIGSKGTHVLLPIPRVECPACGVTRQVAVPFADPQKHYTHAFERYALDLSAHRTIQDVATDLSVAYIRAVRDHLPRAKHVFDHFHVIKLFNDKRNALRRQLFHARTAAGQKVLKGIRWLLLKNPENLDPERNEWPRLAAALRLNEPLATAYYLKEDLQQLWQQADKAAAARVLRAWIRNAAASGIRMLQQFAKTLTQYRQGILAYYDCRISTGPLEGTNNKIKTMQRQAYGFRDQQSFKLKIYALHRMKYALVG
jgi:transposase